MRSILIAIAAASLAIVPACTSAPAPTSPGSVAVTVDKVVLDGRRGFAAAEVVFTAAAKIAQEQIEKGRIKGDSAAWVRDRAIEARKLLVLGKATSDTAEKARAATRLFEIGALFDQLTGGK